jgi:dipeptidase
MMTRMKSIKSTIAFVICSIAIVNNIQTTNACTNYLITPGATTDGSAFISYAADSGSLYGTLGFYPAGDHPSTARRECYDWDSGNYLGSIPEAAHTYNVVGNVNEHQLTITETTFGGLGQFSSQKGAIIDYGSLIWITLQRAKTAQEAITVMDELMQKYGYASDGESFSIGDPNEVWIMEVMSKGEGELGSVWVAQKIPDGYVSGHANQARIRTFIQNDPSTSRFAHDVIDFARKKNLYNGTDAEFSFSDTYDPVSFVSARMCEARVWNMFRQVAAESDFENEYLDYVKGENLTNRMPLYIKPKEKISLNDTFWFMRGHYENTYFDMSVDVGAGPFQSIYRVSIVSIYLFSYIHLIISNTNIIYIYIYTTTGKTVDMER